MELADKIIHLQLAALKPVYSSSLTLPCAEERSLLRAVREHPCDSAQRELGAFYLQHGNPNRVMAELEPAVRTGAAQRDLIGLYAAAAIQAKKFSDAISVLKPLPEPPRQLD